MNRLPILLLVLLFSGCASVFQPGTTSKAEGSCGFNLSEGGFIQELLDPRATARTPGFDDYMAGSYHVDKVELVRRLEAISIDQPDLLGALAVGPFGPLWAFEVATFFRTPDGVQVNWVVMPHARITVKGTKTLSSADFSAWRDSVLSSPHLVKGLEPEVYPPEDEEKDGSIGAVMAFWGDHSGAVHLPLTWFAGGGNAQALESVAGLAEVLFSDSLITYSTSLPEDLVSLSAGDQGIENPCP